MKRITAILLVLILCFNLVSCGEKTPEGGDAEPVSTDVHKIGVIVYNTADEEVIGFREYLQGYIESNFEMVIEGKKRFTTKYFLDMRAACTEMQWESQYQQHPFEAKGRLFPEDSLNRFFKLPEREPDAIVAACDTAEKGSDSVAMPIGYIYGEDVMIPDVVFNNGTPEHTKPECAMKLVKHKVGLAQFESNSAGEYYARDVEEIMRQQGGKTSIRLKRSIAKKTTRIEVESDFILKHFYFLDKSLYKTGDEYGMFIKELCTYVRSGAVPHDDSPDSCAALSELIRTLAGGKAEVIRRPF